MKPRLSLRSSMQSGFTLIEMMIALAIGLFMTAIIASLYLNMRNSFRYQEDFARVQESGRFAMEAISRDFRMLGYTGCGSVTKLANVVTGGATSPYLNFASPVIGYEGGVSTFPAALTSAGVIAGTDAVILLGADTSSELVVQSHDPASAVITTKAHSLKAGEILLINDCNQAALFQSTGPAASNPTTVEHAASVGTPGNCSKELGASCGTAKNYQFKPGSSLMRIYSNAYFVAPSSSGNGRSLWSMSMGGQVNGTSTAKELIEGVENMQITYGLDGNGVRSANQFVKASSIAASDWSKVVAARVSLLVSSAKDNITAAPQTYEFDGLSTTPTDRKLRKIFTESITVRNRTP